MGIVIGSARSDENGKTTGGSAGDQTGKEVSTQDFYMHSKGWYIYRAKSADTAAKLATAMQEACDNDAIGYDQNQRGTLLTQYKSTKSIKAVKTKCECDCSSLVRVCIYQATGTLLSDFNTESEPSVLSGSGLFDKKTCSSSADVYNGDILVTKTKGHTAIVVSGRARSGTSSTSVKYPDVSHYHPVTDWSKVKSICPFLISKATQRQNYIDPTLDDFISGCEANHIPYWVFAYLEKGSEKAQAKYMVTTCKGKIGPYFVGYILDVEDGNSAANVQDALDYIIGLGYKSMIYIGYSDYSKYKSIITGRPDTCAWWEPRYGSNSGSYESSYPCHDGVDLHQYTDKGTCSGVSGSCDLNRLTGTKSESWFTTPLSGADTSGSTSGTTSGTSTGSSSGTGTTTTSTTSLTVDGQIGPKTVKRLQAVLGTTQDGVIDGQKSANKKYWTAITSSVCKWSGGTSAVVKALQKQVGATQDGLLGKKTAKATQTYLIGKGYSCGSTGADGKFGTNSAKALQKWLNAQK